MTKSSRLHCRASNAALRLVAFAAPFVTTILSVLLLKEHVGWHRWCAIAVRSDREWEGFCMALGNPDWCRDASFASFTARATNEDELNRHVSAWTRGRTADEVMRTLQAAGVPAGVVRDVREIMDLDPQIRHRAFYKPMGHPVGGPIRYSGLAFDFSEDQWRIETNAPTLGEHNDYVYGDILGLSPGDVARLKEEGVIA